MENIPETKECRKCKSVLPIGEYYTHKMMKDGRLNFCKSCVKDRVNKRYYEEHEKIAEYERKRFHDPKRKEKVRTYRKKAKIVNQDKFKARNAVSNALRDGRLTKQPCYICGSTTKIQAHHHDYSKPLDVRWVCFRCHREVEHGQIVSGPRKPN